MPIPIPIPRGMSASRDLIDCRCRWWPRGGIVGVITFLFSSALVALGR